MYNAAPPRLGFGGQKHPRFAGDHFFPRTAEAEVVAEIERLLGRTTRDARSA